MEVILYSTGCPKCNVLEAKLKNSSVNFKINSSKEDMINKGFDKLPVLEVDGKYLNFVDAVVWTNEHGIEKAGVQ